MKGRKLAKKRISRTEKSSWDIKNKTNEIGNMLPDKISETPKQLTNPKPNPQRGNLKLGLKPKRKGPHGPTQTIDDANLVITQPATKIEI